MLHILLCPESSYFTYLKIIAIQSSFETKLEWSNCRKQSRDRPWVYTSLYNVLDIRISFPSHTYPIPIPYVSHSHSIRIPFPFHTCPIPLTNGGTLMDQGQRKTISRWHISAYRLYQFIIINIVVNRFIYGHSFIHVCMHIVYIVYM